MNNPFTSTATIQTPNFQAVQAALYNTYCPTTDELKAVYTLPAVEVAAEPDREGSASYFWFVKYHGIKPDGHQSGVQVWLFAQKDGTFIISSHDEPYHVEIPTFGREVAFYIAHRVATERAARMLAELESDHIQKKNRRKFEYYLANWIAHECERLEKEEHVEPDLIHIDADMIHEGLESYESVNNAQIILKPTSENEGENGLINMESEA